MPKTLRLLIYNLLLPVALVLMLPRALIKMRQRGGRWRDLVKRLGWLPAEQEAQLAALPAAPNRLWVHAVSVGEVGIATKLIARLLQVRPELGVVITSTTPTGHALAEDFASRENRVVVLYSPVDLPRVGGRILDAIRPAQIVLVEAEVWPNLMATATQRQIPVSLVNARLSPRSERRFHRFRSLIEPVFQMLEQVLVQEPSDVARWQALGVSADRIHHTGSIKFDPQGAAASDSQVAALRKVLGAAGIHEGQPVLLLASTHPSEEALLTQVYLNLQKQRFPDLALLIVPRHVERTADIVADLKRFGLQVQLRSKVATGAEASAARASGPAVLLIDTTGELRAWQCLATAVVVGKSFLAEGGQNPAEAVMAKKPVLFGPHMENFSALVDLLLSHGGAIQVPDVTMLEKELAFVLADPLAADRYGQAGHAALATHEGATERTVARLLAVGPASASHSPVSSSE